MRPIEFRGIRVDNGEWVEGYYVYCRCHAYILPVHNPDDKDPCFDERWVQEGADDNGWIEVIPETVDQFTGLEDKSGMKIWEGDVIDVHRPGHFGHSHFVVRCFVKWGSVGWIGKKSSGEVCFPLSCDNPYIKVIGDIYQHPDALGE